MGWQRESRVRLSAGRLRICSTMPFPQWRTPFTCLKAASSGWMSDLLQKDFKWQEVYAAFTVSLSNLDSVRQYINHQEEHHPKIDFATEWKLLLEKHGTFCRRGSRNLQRRGFSVVRLKAGLWICFSRNPPLGTARGGLLAYVPPVGRDLIQKGERGFHSRAAKNREK